MRHFKFKNFHLIQVFLLIGILSVGCSPSTGKYIQRGNEDFAKQLYEEALEAYQKAQIKSPEIAQSYYNAANAYYRQGDYLRAAEELSAALELAKEEPLKQNGSYNLGNNSFNSQDLKKAIEAYKAALLINSFDQDAKYNLELALQQQEQQQQEQDQQQQNQDESSGNNGSESNQNNKDSQGEDANNQIQQVQEQDNKEQNQDSETPQELEDETGKSQEKNPDSSDQNEQLNQENQQEKNQNDQNRENNSQNYSQIPAPGQKMTPEQAKQLLAAIAQNTKTLQEYLGQILYVQELPPVQDW